MSLLTFKSVLAILAAAALVSACGGSGQSASPTVGGLKVEPGEAGVTFTWTAVPGVQYWLYGAPASSICKNCGNSPFNWFQIAGAVSRGQSNALISSPYFLTGITNDTLYSFMMDARVNGGPGGDATPSVSATPRLAGATWNSGGNLGTGDITGIAYGPILNSATNSYATTGSYLGMGATGAKYQSTDGLSWTAITSSDKTNWFSTLYALNKFIGIGQSGAVTYSTDLKTWTSATSGVTQNLNAMASNGSMVVAVGNNGTIIRSSDAITWTASTSTPSTLPLYGVGYTINGIWVAVGASGTLLTSSDGATWTAVSSGTTADLKSVASMANIITTNNVAATVYSMVVTGNNGALLQSADGAKWALQSIGTNANLNAVVASVGVLPTNQFVAVGNAGLAYTSTDGLTWTARSTNTSQNLNVLFRGLSPQTRYIALGANGSTVYTQ
jgi:hypothetical protein